MKAADEPAYLTVGTDVSAKYRGAFCEAKIKTVKRLVKVKVIFKHDSSTQVVQDDQVKGPLRIGASVEVKGSDGSYQEAAINKLTDASWYTVVFDDGDERTLRRTSLCLKGERHFAESETLDQLPLTNPEHFGTPVIGKKTNRGRRLSSAPAPEDEREEEPSEDEDDDKRRLNDELLGKVVYVDCNADKRKGWYPALVLSPSCSDEITVKKDQCLVRSFADSKFYPIARKDIRELDWDKVSKPDPVVKQALEEAHKFYQQRIVPESWKVDMSVILESSSSDEEEEEEEAENDEDDEENKQESEEELDPEERDNFLQQLYKFMEDRGTPINKPPVLGYKDLNLFKLFRLVYRHGGCDNIDSGSVWKQIYMDLGIPILNSAASYNVKTAYKKYLYGFEEYCRAADLRFRTIHHIESIGKPVEKDEENGTCDPKKAPTTLDDEKSDDTENDKEEKEVRSPRGRRRNATPAKKEVKELKKEKVNEEISKENKEVKEDSKKQGKETDTGQQKNVSTPKSRAEKNKKEESEKDSEEEEEGDEDTEEDHEDRQTKEGNENKEEEEDEEEEEEEEEDDEFERFPSGTKVKVKYGRGKNQKIYEANIRNSEVDDGEVVYLVHYYGWNTRYDEWVKGDRILWPSERGAPKGKHRRKLKNKQDHEKKDDDKQNKSKRGRPSLKSPPTANSQRSLSKTPGNEGKSGTRSMRNNTSDSSPILNGVEGLPRRRTRRSSGMYDSDKASNGSTNSSDESEVEISADKSVKEEVGSTKTLDEEEKPEGKKLKDICMQEMRELPCEDNLKTTSVKQEVESIEQTDNEKMVTQAEDIRKEIVDKSPKGKGRRSRTRDLYSENSKTILANHIITESREDTEKLESSEAKQLPVPSVPEEAVPVIDTGLSNELTNDEKKPGKRKSPEQLTPDKRLRIESEEKMQTVKDIAIENMEYFAGDFEESKTVDRLELENGEASPLEIVTNRCVKQELEAPCLEIEENISLKTDEDIMPPIGPEALVCHEVDLDDFDEKEKSSNEDVRAGNSGSNSPESVIAVVSGSVQQVLPIASPALLHQDEVRSVKSESDITIEVDSVAGESQEGLCESESANGFDASTSSSSSIIVQEAENKEKGQKRISDNSNGTPAKKQKRSHKRSNVSSKNEKNGTGNSSDSEDLAVTDNSNKCTPVKSSNKSQKLGRSPSRTSPNSKDGDKHKEKDGSDGTSPRTYKWSFQLTDLNNLTSAERIAFLQDKLQEIRKYYMSLKSEVASIDRRRKRLKKKEREVTSAAPGTSSASSETGMSPTSSSPAQNSVAVECR
ncbi:AT-rich interactive domain-containing protein 4A [Carcharodon carcharias]|uniref:AT-rich interactive domain-containing protein 4A n=1 Tax=Carcharodon carcharias TaxID=13397 RepID=UPI001B7EF7D8|nr:AT-rich interactive domain-containing protein 4A [Carcharodon carcharias]XP_041070229.1 AT-rich interactive domain-containing protein 4A [Carcharodon carcharias]XP_041070230.1 AT-rich interactive domain-containing protein 4A [Carcharodon carcharias]XP_041070232.1 AT-rich interactive domain-containing protein 4A [Carcharodon carcharias]XP_041070233.1 AT-rich interactive domain-containing protein 4A [Carcharodon carcharias]